MSITLATTARSSGGVWRHICDLATGFTDLGCEVVLALDSEASELLEHANRMGWPCVTFDKDSNPVTDVFHIHLHDTFDKRALLEIARRRMAGSKVVVTEHLPHTNASDPALLPGRRRLGARQAKTAFKLAQHSMSNASIVISRASAAFMAKRYGRTARNLNIVPYGIPIEPYQPLPEVRECVRVAVLASLIMQKGIDVLVRAAGIARERWEVDVIGEGTQRATLERLIARHAPGRVRLHGWQQDSAQWIADSHLVCVPSRWEESPYAALEAMARGRPVVAARVDGLVQIVGTGDCGILVPPEDPTALANALDLLAREPKRLRSMAIHAQERVRAFFSFEKMITRTLAIYRTTL